MDFKGFDAGALSGSNRAAIPFQAAVGEAQGNRRIQEEIKRDATDDWAQVLYNRGAGRSIFSPLSQASLFNVNPAVLSSITAQN